MTRKFTKYPSTKICCATDLDPNSKFRTNLISYADFIFNSFAQTVDSKFDDMLTSQISDMKAFFDCFRDITDARLASSVPGVSFKRECSMSGGEGVCYFWISLPADTYDMFKSEYPQYENDVEECILRIGGYAGEDNIDVIFPDAAMIVDELIYFGATNSKPLTQQDIADILSEFISFIDYSLTDALNTATDTYANYN